MAKPSPRSESLLAALPTELSQSLFAKARPLSVKADQTLFVAGDEGDGCYRVELLKASIGAPAGGERILAILGPGSVVAALGFGYLLAGFEVELRRPHRVRGVWAIPA
jgi:CRP/FNR family transcriptional regulator, cyclic AMP receptor protein